MAMMNRAMFGKQMKPSLTKAAKPMALPAKPARAVKPAFKKIPTKGGTKIRPMRGFSK